MPGPKFARHPISRDAPEPAPATAGGALGMRGAGVPFAGPLAVRRLDILNTSNSAAGGAVGRAGRGGVGIGLGIGLKSG